MMKKMIGTSLLVLLLLPLMASAQMYKWKDKNGVTQYSDTPPPSTNVEELKLKNAPPKPSAKEAEAAAKKSTAKSGDKLDKDAAKRQVDAENSKKEDEAKEAERKIKEANCSAAKANYNTYKQGGRIIKNNEAGERSYLSDADIAKGLEESKQNIEKNCDQ